MSCPYDTDIGGGAAAFSALRQLLRLDGEMDPSHTELVNVDNPQSGIGAGSRSNAMTTLTTAIALDLGDTGIRANALCPGFVDTELNVPHYTALWGREAREVGLPISSRSRGRCCCRTDRPRRRDRRRWRRGGQRLTYSRRQAVRCPGSLERDRALTRPPRGAAHTP
jgi:hypothetical protein